MKTITKDSIAHKIQKELGFSKNFSDDFVTSLFAEVVSIIKSEKKINIPNIGSFKIHHKKARPGMDIKRGESITIQPRNIVRFVPSRSLKERLNG
jgi:nucleoid DNA-binding protein